MLYYCDIRDVSKEGSRISTKIKFQSCKEFLILIKNYQIWKFRMQRLITLI